MPDLNELTRISRAQHEALKPCQDSSPIAATEGREMLGRFVVRGGDTCQTEEVISLLARVSLDQSVRLQESNEKLSRKLIFLTWVLIVLTVVLVVLPILKRG